MAHEVKLQLGTLLSHMEEVVQVLVTLPSIQLPDNVRETTAEDNLSAWTLPLPQMFSKSYN